jgi:hypothetical protein
MEGGREAGKEKRKEGWGEEGWGKRKERKKGERKLVSNAGYLNYKYIASSIVLILIHVFFTDYIKN